MTRIAEVLKSWFLTLLVVTVPLTVSLFFMKFVQRKLKVVWETSRTYPLLFTIIVSKQTDLA